MTLRFLRRLRVAPVVASALLAACSGSPGVTPARSNSVAMLHAALKPALTPADFVFLQSPKRTDDTPAYLYCPPGWKLIAGGAQYAKNGYMAGIGTVEYGFGGWESGVNYIKTVSQQGGRYVSYDGAAWAWVSCADAAAAPYFTWVHNYAPGRDGFIPAGCPNGYQMIAGFATGPGAALPQWAYWQGARNREYWAEGKSTAWASCGAAQVVHVQNLWGKPPAVLQACAPGTVAIGGSSGYRGAPGQPSYLGPAQMQFPATQHGIATGWWVYGNTSKIMNHIACAP